MENQGEKRKIIVMLFGPFRESARSRELEVFIPVEGTISDLRDELRELLCPSPGSRVGELLKSSAIGSEDRILEDTDVLGELESVALLPPVSGG